MKRVFFLFLLACLFSGPASATINVEKFVSPDIKDDYCGAMIDFRFCKCGFHGEKGFCKQIGQTEATANETVQNGFDKYVEQKRSSFVANCSGENDILSGDTCTKCIDEHFRYQDACVTHEEKCGKEDLHLRFDVKTAVCDCEPNYEKQESGFCEKIGPTEIKVEWQDEQSPPLLADGKNVGIANVSVRALKEENQPFLPVKMVLTSGSLGVLNVEDTGDNHYRVTFTTPDLTNSDPSKNYQAGINLEFTALNAEGIKEEQNKVVPVQLVLYTPVKISAYGFEAKDEKMIFKGGVANLIVNAESGKAEEEYFLIAGANIELPEKKIFTTDEKGEAKIPTPNDFLKGTTDDTKFTLVLTEEVNTQLSQARKKMTDLGVLGENTTVNAFLNDFVKNLASAKNDTERKSLVEGLKRLNYALFFVNKGQTFGKVSADSLAVVTNDAVANMVDMLDSVTGITGKITERANKAGLKLSNKALEKISAEVGKVYKAALLKLGAAMQTGISYYAPDSKIYLGGLLQFLEDKFALADNLKNKTAENFDYQKGIKEYFYLQVDKAAKDQMKEIEVSIINGNQNGFPTLENSADLNIARDNYANMADRYIKAEQAEYWRVMTKSWFDLSFDVVGKGVSIIFPVYAELVGQVENMYKLARSGFVDAANMFQWYKTHGDIMAQMDKGLKRSLGINDNEQAGAHNDAKFLQLVPAANAENFNDPSLFMDATADALLYESFAEIGLALAEEYPDTAKEFDALIKQLKDKSDIASQKAQELQAEAKKDIPTEDYSLWNISETAEPQATKNVQEKNSNIKIIILAGGIFLLLTAGMVFWRKKK
jgi:hypothetical protein